MTNKQFMKWYLELATQEYSKNGNDLKKILGI